jgi:hypothetical protein
MPSLTAQCCGGAVRSTHMRWKTFDRAPSLRQPSGALTTQGCQHMRPGWQSLVIPPARRSTALPGQPMRRALRSRVSAVAHAVQRRAGIVAPVDDASTTAWTTSRGRRRPCGYVLHRRVAAPHTAPHACMLAPSAAHMVAGKRLRSCCGARCRPLAEPRMRAPAAVGPHAGQGFTRATWPQPCARQSC